MRPRRLEIAGFGAFRDPTEVDFADAELVAFVGPTGSGKSTLIDAITFALYGSVARYDDLRVVEPAVSALANEARVLLEFSVGDDIYTVVRVVRRTANGATTKEARLERGDETISGTARELTKSIEGLLGLNFEQFTKTVVLPQGDFADFLHDSAADRQKLLRRLFDLELYERMGKDARARGKAATEKAGWITEQLAHEGEVTQQAVDELDARHRAIRDLRETVIADVRRVEKLDGELQTITQELQRLEKDGALLDGIAVPDGLAELDSGLREAVEGVTRAEAALAEARNKRDTADEAVAAGPDAASCTRLIERYGELDGAADERVKAQTRHDEAAKTLSECEEAAETIRAELDAAKVAVREARAARDDAAAAADAGPDATLCEQLLEAFDDRERATNELETCRADVGVAAGAAETAADSLAAVAEQLQAVTARRDRARIEAGAAGLVAELAVGEPCPVCRQVVHDIPDHDANAELAAVEAELGAIQEAHRTADEQRRKADAALDRARNAEAAVQQRITELDERLADVGTRPEVEADLERATALQTAAAAAVKAMTEAENAEHALASDPERTKVLDAVTGAGKELAAATEALSAAGQRFDALTEELRDAPAVAQLEAELATSKELANAAKQAKDLVAGAEKAHAEAKAHHDRATNAIEEQRRQFVVARDRVAPLGPPATDGAELGSDWTALVAWAEEWLVAAAARQKMLDGDVQRVTTERNAIQTSVEERVAEWIDPASTGGVLEKLASAEATAGHDHEQAKAKREQQSAQRLEIEELTETAQVSKELGRLLAADGFEAWMLEEAVADLVDRATERLLGLSGGAYSLIADRTEFKVCDHRNADETRDAKTLSGGETFLTSLALALALADSVAEMATSGAPRLESIFLDEGFGTLDPETLETVASAIVDLGASGRMVGIVTHIAELADQIPVRLEVAKGPTTATVRRVEV